MTYTRRELERATAHILTVPATYSIGVAVADGLSPVANIAQQIEATAALNAGFFDPQNGKTTSYITLDSNQVGDPRQNPRLMENPDLAPYLSQILNRSEFRRYYCKTEEGNVQGVDTLNEGEGMRNRETRYAIALHNASSPEGCRILDSVGGGPRLLPVLTSIDEGFVAIAGDTRIRDALGETQPNARSAVGLTATGDVLMVMAAQRPELQPSGLTLAELADLMRELGAVDALNLDGGSSTALYYQGQTYLGRWSEGQPVERPVKSALVVKE
ncbi:MAG: phosphodiester glycosidase family protein [Elainellaceae cyanobacterium]